MRKESWFLILFMVVITVGAASCWPKSMPSPLEWHNLAPGKSTIDDVRKLWADQSPTSDITNGNQRKASFLIEFGSSFAPPSKEYRFWFEKDHLQVIDIQWSSTGLAEVGYQSLGEIVGKLGQPTIVTWSEKRRVRTVIWPEQGLLAYVRYGRAPYTTDPNAAEIWGIGFFEPVLQESFRASPAGLLVPRENQYAPGTTDAADGAPEDPFNWDLLTPIPATPGTQ